MLVCRGLELEDSDIPNSLASTVPDVGSGVVGLKSHV